ncbi:hypothetical protein NCC49_001284 [Naganishia albida]|nr:hypothetical protein NCC49_001284 [Naganishia albida]
MSQQPPDYNQVIKEEEEFRRDVSAARVPVERPLASNRVHSQTMPLNESPYPSDKSGRQGAPSSPYVQPGPRPGMRYGATSNPYISQQPQPIGQPMHYYRDPAGTSA